MKNIMQIFACRCFFIPLFITLLANLNAQSSSFISFNNLMTESVWNHKIIYDIEQDKSGLIWVGTDNGLYMYNGYQYYLQPDFGDNVINKLLSIENGLLIGTNLGLYLYRSDNGKFIEISLTAWGDKKNKQFKVRAIYYYNNKYYVGTNDGLLILDKDLKVESHILFAMKDNHINSNIVRAIISDRKGNIWIGTYNGVYRLVPNNKEIEYVQSIDMRPIDPVNNLVLSFENIPGDDKHLLIGQETGLSIINIENLDYKVYRKDISSNLSNNSIKCIKCLSDSIAIIGTDNGLNLLNINNGKCLNYFHEAEIKYSLSDNIISDISIDNANKLVWLATNKGISKINLSLRLEAKLFSYSKNSLYYNMHDIIEDEDGSAWIATTNGVLCYNNEIYKVFDVESGLKHNNSNVVFEDLSHNVWIGTLNGVNYVDYENNIAVNVVGDDTKYVRGIHQSVSNDIWIVDDVGILKVEFDGRIYSLKRVELKNETFNSSNTEIIVSSIDKDVIWLGTNSGIYSYNTITGNFILVNNSSLYRNITSIEVIGNIMCFGTPSGVWGYDKIKQLFFPVNISDGKVSVVDMAFDGSMLWIATNKVLYKYDFYTHSTSKYDYVNDIPLDGETPQCIYSSKNHIIIGGYGKYVSFDRLKVKSKKEYSPVAITNVMLNDTIYNLNPRNVTLDYSNSNIKIEFSLLNYSTVGNKYRYRLVGYEDEFVSPKDGINNVEYTNLPPGSYCFEVYGANEDDKWSDSVAKLDIKVNNPWWLQTWAYVLYFLFFILFILFLTLIIKWRINVLEKKQNEILKQKNIQELNNLRMQFFANVSHEFKTPLSLILGPVEVLSEELKSESKLNVQLDILNKNVGRLRRLVEQIMNLCKLENNEMKYRPEMGELVQFVRNICNEFLYIAEQKNIKLSLDSEAESILMLFDEDKLEEVIYNLVDNALKFTPVDGEVTVSIYRDNSNIDRVCIEIRDNGIGISQNDLKHIFDKFFQADNFHLTDRKGTGIGLSIVKQFVEMHNGEIEVSSNVNVGTSFKVKLPMISVYDKYTDGNEVEIKERPTIVVVEDNPDMREYLKINLHDKYNIILSEDGVVGWNVIKNKLPDLVLSDILMPRMDGMELLHKIRNEFQTEHIPVVFLTALNEDMKLKEGLEAGLTTYITKPFSISVLRLKISAILADRKRLQEKIRLQVIQKPSEVKCESREEKFVRDFVKIVEDNMDNPELDVELLCKELGYSHQQTYRKIHAVTGKSINGFVRYIRLNRAAQLLKDSDYNMSEIMDKIGMSNRTYFIKIFKEEFGKTPSEYREGGFGVDD